MAKTRKVIKSKKPKPDNRKIKISIDWDSKDNGYSSLNNKKVLQFIIDNIKEGYNLVQTQPDKPFICNGKTILYLQAIKIKSWPQTPEWEKTDNYIKCKTFNDWIKISPCDIGHKAKIFVKLKSNPYIAGFATYLMSIFSGYITPDKHKEFVKAAKLIFKNKPVYIHNQDVDWFHMKEHIKRDVALP